jgi:hypothetical protein
MLKFFASVFLFLGLITLTALKPIYLPQVWLDTLSDFAVGSLYFNGFLPIQFAIDTFLFIILVFCYLLLFRFLMGFISMFTGGGKPEI